MRVWLVGRWHILSLLTVVDITQTQTDRSRQKDRHRQTETDLHSQRDRQMQEDTDMQRQTDKARD